MCASTSAPFLRPVPRAPRRRSRRGTSMDQIQALRETDSTGRLADVVCEELARMIHSGRLKEGARLPAERDLMQRFGVSRGAVREAIASLSSRGLVMTRFGHRPVVRKPDYEVAIGRLGTLVGHLVADRMGTWNLFSSRIFLEAALARWAAGHARRDDLEDLRATLEANREAIGHSARFYETDTAFHAVLYRIPGNPIYPALHKAYVEWLTQHWHSMRSSADIDRMNFAGHQAIFDAVAARDPDAAEEALRRHLGAALEFLRSTFLTEAG